MIFDLFHSISDPVVHGRKLGSRGSYQNFLDQAMLAEDLGMDTLWLAESHFSSETQKRTSVATIPEFYGEVGLNCDSYQWFQLLAGRTRRIHFGTAIHNIVGGSGGPIASADRVNTLSFLNENFWDEPRELRIGVAAGRFPYQNTPFGIVPPVGAAPAEWNQRKRLIFVEALEIFLRLVNGEELSSADIHLPGNVSNWWNFERLKLVPDAPSSHLHIVLGSSDPQALEIGLKYRDLDLFNLSFTPPAEIEKLHDKMATLASQYGRSWHRARLPRTVMVFIDRDRKRAQALANDVLDTYIEAMRGTAAVPDKSVLLQRALVGDAAEVRDQLSPSNPRQFHPDDRLMLWFEFNQLENEQIKSQMKYFFEEVVSRL